MQIKKSAPPADLDQIREQLYDGAYIEIAQATGYSYKLVVAVMHGNRVNPIIIAAARDLISMHRDNISQIRLKHRRQPTKVSLKRQKVA